MLSNENIVIKDAYFFAEILDKCTFGSCFFVYRIFAIA